MDGMWVLESVFRRMASRLMVWSRPHQGALRRQWALLPQAQLASSGMLGQRWEIAPPPSPLAAAARERVILTHTARNRTMQYCAIIETEGAEQHHRTVTIITRPTKLMQLFSV